MLTDSSAGEMATSGNDTARSAISPVGLDVDGAGSYQLGASAVVPNLGPAAVSARAPGVGGEDDDDFHAVPQGRVAGTAAACKPCGTLHGNVIQLWGPRTGRFPRSCQWGPDWPCNLVTFALILGPSIPFLILVAPEMHIAVIIVGLVLLLFALAMLSLTALSDPGYLPKQSKAQMEVQRRSMEEQGMSGTFTVCQFCNVIRVYNTSHCYDCNAW